jgi:hypothetical protein
LTSSENKVHLEADLNDKRLTRRFNQILNALRANPSASIPAALESKAATKGASRFFLNKKVKYKKLLMAHTANIDTSSASFDDYFCCLSDTVSLDFSSKRGAENLGYLTNKHLRGTYLHNDMIISSLGVVKGLLKQQYNERSLGYLGKADERRGLPIEEKESYRWLLSFLRAQKFSIERGVKMIWIADREADINDIYVSRNHSVMQILVRSQHNRVLKNSNTKLYSYLKQQPTQGTYEIEIIHPKTLKKRVATLAVRFCPIQLGCGYSRPHKYRSHIPAMNAIEVYEIDPPADIDEPIRWVLLTTLAVKSFEQARWIIGLYVKRWLIERFHYLLKTGGANIESLQHEQPHTLHNVITTYSITIMEVMKIRYLAENQPDTTIVQAGLSVQECKILYAYTRKYIRKDLVFDEQQPPTMWEFCRVLGMLGGFIPRRRQPLPGLKILTRAMEKFKILIKAHDVYMSKNEI